MSSSKYVGWYDLYICRQVKDFWIGFQYILIILIWGTKVCWIHQNTHLLTSLVLMHHINFYSTWQSVSQSSKIVVLLFIRRKLPTFAWKLPFLRHFKQKLSADEFWFIHGKIWLWKGFYCRFSFVPHFEVNRHTHTHKIPFWFDRMRISWTHIDYQNSDFTVIHFRNRDSSVYLETYDHVIQSHRIIFHMPRHRIRASFH